MPYGNDQWIEDLEKNHARAERRVARENDRALRERLRTEFRVPPEFEDLAVSIWWDGKAD